MKNEKTTCPKCDCESEPQAINFHDIDLETGVVEIVDYRCPCCEFEWSGKENA